MRDKMATCGPGGPSRCETQQNGLRSAAFVVEGLAFLCPQHTSTALLRSLLSLDGPVFLFLGLCQPDSAKLKIIPALEL